MFLYVSICSSLKSRQIWGGPLTNQEPLVQTRFDWSKVLGAVGSMNSIVTVGGLEVHRSAIAKLLPKLNPAYPSFNNVKMIFFFSFSLSQGFCNTSKPDLFCWTTLWRFFYFLFLQVKSALSAASQLCSQDSVFESHTLLHRRVDMMSVICTVHIINQPNLHPHYMVSSVRVAFYISLENHNFSLLLNLQCLCALQMACCSCQLLDSDSGLPNTKPWPVLDMKHLHCKRMSALLSMWEDFATGTEKCFFFFFFFVLRRWFPSVGLTHAGATIAK